MNLSVRLSAAAVLLLALSCSGTLSPAGLSVGRNGVAELALHYSAPLENPFLEIEASAVFTAPGSGRRVNVDGFYDGDSTWKFRFAPDEEGDWTAELKLTLKGNTVASRLARIDCRGTDPLRGRGFIRRSQTNPYRLAYADGTPYYAIGIQPCGDVEEGLDGPRRSEGQWRSVPMDQFLDEFTGAANLFRIQLGQGTTRGCAREIMTDELGPFRYDLDVCRTLDETYRLLGGRGFASILILFQDMSLWGLDTTVFGINMTLEGWKDRSNRELMDQVRHYVRYIVARYAVYTDIWEIFNEDVYSPDAWLEEIAAYIRSLDPYGHLLTTNYERPYAAWCDLVTPHLYLSIPAHETPLYLDHEIVRHKSWNKPVLYTEFGNHGEISNLDPLKWRAAVWTAFMDESAILFWSMGGIITEPHTGGGNSNAYFGPDDRRAFRNFHAFTDSLPADLRPVMNGFAGSEGVARWALSNGRVSALYVHHTAGYDSSLSCEMYLWSWPGTFTIRWYDPASGVWTTGETIASRGNALVFNTPEFTVDLAALITRID